MELNNDYDNFEPMEGRKVTKFREPPQEDNRPFNDKIKKLMFG